MKNNFKEPVFREFDFDLSEESGNYIKGNKAELVGKTKIAVEEESHEGVKIILKKDGNDSIKEIKFVCSCGQTKSVVLDYSDSPDEFE